MADNTPQTGTDNIATDDITTMNGATIAAGTAKAQRVKVGWGTDSTFRDVEPTFGLPISETDGETGIVAGMTSLRDRQFVQRNTVLADSIADGLNPFWTQTVSNGGTITVVGGEGLIQSNTTTSGTAQLISTTPPYYPGQVTWFNSAIRVGDTGSAGNVRRWGAFTVLAGVPQDGFYYELNGTVLNAVSVKAGAATAVASTAWTKF